MIARALPMLTVLVLVAGCTLRTAPPAKIDVLLSAERTIAAAIETLGTAVALGTIDRAGLEYAALYQRLVQASAFLDSAWSAYRAGDMLGSQQATHQALDVYATLRPDLARIAGGAP